MKVFYIFCRIRQAVVLPDVPRSIIGPEYSVVGSENRRVPTDDSGNLWVFLENLIEKAADAGTVPSQGVFKILVKTQIALIKIPGRDRAAVGAVQGQVEEGQV